MSEKKIQPSKVEAVKELTDKFGSSTSFFFTHYRGMTVEQITNLRNQLRKLNTEYKVVKNNFARIAFHNTNVKSVDEFLVGPTALAMVRGDAGPVAKVFVEFQKEVPTLELKAGYVDGTLFNAAQVEAFSKLPSKLELLSSLMGTMQAPLQNFVYALNGVTTKLVRTVQAVADKKASE